MLDEKIRLICLDVEATEKPVIYLTDSEWLTTQRNRRARLAGEDEQEFIPNFRYAVAVTKPYKGTRKNPKPEHFYGIILYLMSNYEVIVGANGTEADDMLAMAQTKDTIICSRDKDLRIVPGWHFSWECGGQRSIGPHQTDVVGSIELIKKSTINPETGKVKALPPSVLGYGLQMFYHQMLAGDTADNIQGLLGFGAVKAVKTLAGLDNAFDLHEKVMAEYKAHDKVEDAQALFDENAALLWMIQEEGVGYVDPSAEFPDPTEGKAPKKSKKDKKKGKGKKGKGKKSKKNKDLDGDKIPF